MASDTYLQKPEWLTEEEIEKYKKLLRECPSPLTDEELAHWSYDGHNDIQRADARFAYQLLSKYGLLEDTE